jgi:hypothetical protein
MASVHRTDDEGGAPSREYRPRLTRPRKASGLAPACLTLAVAAALSLAPSARAYTTDPHIAAFVQVFASGTPAQVRCPDSLEEWSLDLGGPLAAEEIYGRTFTRTSVVEFRFDLCPILADLVGSSADDSTKALAVLTLLHESYHVRHWAWRLDEARVECQAIRHFRVGVRVLGGSQQLADELFPLALSWHTSITRTPAYYLPSCRVPR